MGNPFGVYNLVRGTEAVDFQLNNKLAPRLQALFQSVIDYRDNLDYKGVPNNVTARREYRVNSVFKYFQTVASAEYKKIVFEETGLAVNKLHTYGGMTMPPMCFFACDLSFNNLNEAMELIARMTATGDADYYGEMGDISKFFDKKTSRINAKYFNAKKTHAVATDFYFDVNTAFCIHDFYSNDYCVPLTAAEITAIMLHEIGHALTFLEHCSDLFATNNRIEKELCEMMKFAKSSKDGPSKLVDCYQIFNNSYNYFVPQIKSLMQQVSKYGGENKAYYSRLLNMTLLAFENTKKAADEYYREPDGESIFITIGSIIVNVFYMVLIIMSLIAMYVSLFIAAQMVATAILVDSQKYAYTTGDTNKSSDIVASTNNVFLLERWADEFAVRHGYGAEQASSLNKIHQYFSYMAVGEISSDRLRKSKLFSLILFVFGYITQRLSIIGLLDPAGYEGAYARNVRLLQDAYGFFKKTDIPVHLRDKWIRNIEDLKKAVKASKSISDYEFSQALIGIFKNITQPYRWYTLISNANLDKDMALISNRIDDFINNPLYYQASRLLASK